MDVPHHYRVIYLHSKKELVKVVHQKVETGKREKNIILFRVKEKENKDEAKENDKEVIRKLLETCEVEDGMESVAEYKRLGAKSTNSDRPILLKFKELDSKVQLYKNIRNLAGEEISVSHDMTQEEREVSKKLVAEARKKQEEDPEHRYRVRGTPGNLRIVQMPLTGRLD